MLSMLVKYFSVVIFSKYHYVAKSCFIDRCVRGKLNERKNSTVGWASFIGWLGN